MLKLERKNKDINVSFRRQLSSVDRTFLIAFALAASIHLTGFLIFHVQPFKLKSIETIFPPVAVNIDFRPISENAILSNLNMKQQHQPKIEKPPLMKPKLPTLLHSDHNKGFIYSRMPSKNIDPFQKFEENVEKAELVKLVREPTRGNACIISGPLGDKGRRDSNTPPVVKEQLVYEVKLDDQKGKIISIQQIGGGKNLEAEQYLSAIDFETTSDGVFTTGTVEFLGGGRDD